MEIAGPRILQSQELYWPSRLNDFVREAKLGKYQHWIRSHPDSSAYLRETACPLNEPDFASTLFESDGQCETTDTCSLSEQ